MNGGPHLISDHIPSSTAPEPNYADPAFGAVASFADKLASDTLNVPSALAEAEAGEFADFVPPGIPIPYSGPPVAVRRDMDPIPEGPWFYVEPTLDEIEAVQDLDERAWLLYARVVNKPGPISGRELEMINPMLGRDGPVYLLLECRLAPPPERDDKPAPRKQPLAPAAPPPLCLFNAFGIDIMPGETRA